jgi:hypothetical protein
VIRSGDYLAQLAVSNYTYTENGKRAYVRSCVRRDVGWEWTSWVALV